VFTDPVVSSGSVDSPSEDFFELTDFWMKKGVERIFYVDNLEADEFSEEIIKVFYMDSLGVGDVNKAQNSLSSKSKGNFIMFRGFK
ncbi:MAG: hypothetical protein KDK36_02255, partial [Leptospiraceae bacterium]|nr:hypothetical protein [Leptospiraceae bacterium]